MKCPLKVKRKLRRDLKQPGNGKAATHGEQRSGWAPCRSCWRSPRPGRTQAASTLIVIDPTHLLSSCPVLSSPVPFTGLG